MADFLSLIFESSSFTVSETSGFSHTQQNYFGGQDFYDGGTLKGWSQENLFGGKDFYNSQGEMIESSRANIFEGKDITDSNGAFKGQTIPDIAGETHYDSNGRKIGVMSETERQVSWQDTQGSIQTWRSNLMGGGNGDPLHGMSGLTFPSIL